MMDSLLGQRYEVRQEIGRGGYGQVCKGFDHKKGKKVAIKLEKVDELEGQVSSLKKEQEVYSKLKGEESIGITNIHQFGSDLINDDLDNSLDNNGYILHYMVMDLLGPDLEELFGECSEKFTLKTVLLLVDQMIRIIQYVHSKDYIHGDIKPGNFVIGRGKTRNMIYMVDFGLAQRYRDSQTKEHIAYSDTASYRGTTMFTSLNCHHCIQKSRRDDLESLGYVLLYLLRGSLPWQGIEGWNDKREKRQLVYEEKASISIERLCTGVPCEFVSYMVYCRSLQFDEEPDYDYLRKLFQDLYNQAGFTDVIEYDWTETQYSESRYYMVKDLNSSDMSPEDVFYYLDVSYKPMLEPQILSLDTIEECLEYMFKFVANTKDQMNSENDFKWNDMNEMVKYYVENNEDISWIYWNDIMDYKTTKEDEMSAYEKVLACHEDSGLPGLYFSHSVYCLYKNRFEYQDKLENRDKTAVGEKSAVVKRFLDSAASIINPQYFMRSQQTIEFYIGKDKITDSSIHLESRNPRVTVRPEGIFTSLPKSFPEYSLTDPVWQLVVEVYGPEKILNKQDGRGSEDDASTSMGSTASTSMDSPISTSMDSPISTSMDSPTPPNTVNRTSSLYSEKATELIRSQNLITERLYRYRVTKEIKKCLPNPCREDRTTRKKMLGQHVLQLFAQFKKFAKYIGRDDFHEVKQSVGLFMINEYVYLSRLDMCTLVYMAVIGEQYKYHKNTIFKEHGRPQITYSHFRLDITKRSNRIALLIFLKAYVYPHMSNTYQEKTSIGEMLADMSKT